MNLAYVSLAALVVAILVSCFTELNVGILALALAWVVGVYIGGIPLNDVIGGFPVSLFLTLAGVTLLFSQAQMNGTLDRIAHRAVRMCRGNAGLIPMMFFILGCGLASLGPGNISTAALLGADGDGDRRARGDSSVPDDHHGRQRRAGGRALAVRADRRHRERADDQDWPAGPRVVYLLDESGRPRRGGIRRVFSVRWLKLFKSGGVAEIEQKPEEIEFDRSNIITMVVIGALLIGVLFFRVNVGMGAFAGAVLLAVAGAADHKEAIKKMPWSVIVMVSGVTVLIALMEKTGGLDLFTAALARLATPGTITGVIAFVTGLISVYSSTSGVVLPAFLPTIPGLIERLGGGNPLAIAASMNIGAHLVDLSPLSTTGALCIAAISSGENIRSVFNKLLIWGLSMTIVGAIFCYVFF